MTADEPANDERNLLCHCRLLRTHKVPIANMAISHAGVEVDDQNNQQSTKVVDPG